MNKVILGSLVMLLSLSAHLAKAAPAQGDGSKYAEHEAIRQQHQQYEQAQRAAGNPKKQKPSHQQNQINHVDKQYIYNH